MSKKKGKAKVTFESEGHKIKMLIEEQEDDTLTFKITAENPESLKEQEGLHSQMASIFLDAFNHMGAEVISKKVN